MSKKRLICVVIIIVLFIIAILLSLRYYKNKYIISFETGTSDGILNKYVDRNNKVDVPIEPSKDGYIFVEWQYEGEKFDFNTEIRKNITLTAKWVKEEYVIVNFITNTVEQINERKILKGSIINDLPIVSKENHEFIGWYINDKLYTNEEINNDVTLTAKYKENTPEYKIGDRVKIIGCYSKTSTSNKCNNTKAIGWNRKILNIIEGAEYPYVVGNSSGVTGFFKVDSIMIK